MYCLLCHQAFYEKTTWQFVLGLTTPANICELCSDKLAEIEGEICEKCGRSFAHLDSQYRTGNLCADCIRWQSRSRNESLDKNRSVYLYNDFLEEIIAKWKYRGDAELTKLFLGRLQELAKQFQVDATVPIPLSAARIYERSFNQAQLLAEGLPYPIVKALQKPEESLKQSKKTRLERLEQKESFQIVAACLDEIQGKSVLLVDDIYTTGATLYGAAAILKANGAAKVFAITVARG